MVIVVLMQRHVSKGQSRGQAQQGGAVLHLRMGELRWTHQYSVNLSWNTLKMVCNLPPSLTPIWLWDRKSWANSKMTFLLVFITKLCSFFSLFVISWKKKKSLCSFPADGLSVISDEFDRIKERWWWTYRSLISQFSEPVYELSNAFLLPHVSLFFFLVRLHFSDPVNCSRGIFQLVSRVLFAE